MRKKQKCIVFSTEQKMWTIPTIAKNIPEWGYLDLLYFSLNDITKRLYEIKLIRRNTERYSWSLWQGLDFHLKTSHCLQEDSSCTFGPNVFRNLLFSLVKRLHIICTRHELENVFMISFTAVNNHIKTFFQLHQRHARLKNTVGLI